MPVSSPSTHGFFSAAAWREKPARVQLLGLCPLLVVSNSVANGLALAFAAALVLIGSNPLIAGLRPRIPDAARLPMFVLVVASFTSCAVLILQAFAYESYLLLALFVPVIVTNGIIPAAAQADAQHRRVVDALIAAVGTALGFAIALLLLGAVRELLGSGTLGAGVPLTDGEPWLALPDAPMLLAALSPGAFLIGGLLLALGRALFGRRAA